LKKNIRDVHDNINHHYERKRPSEAADSDPEIDPKTPVPTKKVW
jgi:hypothetical protein